MKNIIRQILREEINKNDDKIGKKFWFEYHCFESPASCDAELWYRSHREVTVLSRGKDDHDEFPEEPKTYIVQFEDGFKGVVYDDELMNSPEEFYRPTPPKKQKTDENIDIPINVGDEVLGGKFLNKKIIVKSIKKDGKGGYLINGKPLLRFRVKKK